MRGSSLILNKGQTWRSNLYQAREHPGPDALPSDGKVQQKVAPGSLDELSKNSIISAWGERRGDRVIATILLYEQP